MLDTSRECVIFLHKSLFKLQNSIAFLWIIFWINPLENNAAAHELRWHQNFPHSY